MSFVLGLTGSIGMGKSTTAAMFAEAGIPVWDADAVVHRLYAAGGKGAAAVAALFPGAVAADGAVDRVALRAILQADHSALDRLNAVIHPLVAQDRAEFLDRNSKAEVVLFDVPLLFETGLDKACDAIAVVSVPPDVQRERVLARGMNEADLALILSRQMPDEEKRARADHVIPTTSLDEAHAAVRRILAEVPRRKVRDA